MQTPPAKFYCISVLSQLLEVLSALQSPLDSPAPAPVPVSLLILDFGCQV